MLSRFDQYWCGCWQRRCAAGRMSMKKGFDWYGSGPKRTAGRPILSSRAIWEHPANLLRVMSSAKEFREYARERLDWAKTARTERERAIFIQMAETWID